MPLYEYAGNMHMHTRYSDGGAYHDALAQAALKAKLDFIIVTDHNLYLDGFDGYYGDEQQGYVLMLCGEEVHDRNRLPQVNHALVYNAGREVCQYATSPQKLIDEVASLGGLTFLAHPHDAAVKWLSPHDEGFAIPWVDWHVTGYNGLEIWNYMADWKDTLPTVSQAILAFFRPQWFMTAPKASLLAKWDELTASGQKVVGIGNADAHGVAFKFGPFTHTVFPYDFLFRGINTHILSETPFVGDLAQDAPLVYEALARGRAFIAYDYIGQTRGFRFLAQGRGVEALMGDDLPLTEQGVDLYACTPAPAHLKLIHNGNLVAEVPQGDTLSYHATQAGAYRVEAWRVYRGKPRCWILSNPIYVA